ncbi:hypothetical protein [Lacipirellula sp.]|uniref:hypothetical protein n=1 Tax=Lacipirellula sp. TaxID=2691419 RepID=UPI003D1480ED
MVASVAHLSPPAPRTFAEFVLTKSWQDIGMQVHRLGGTYQGFSGQGHNAQIDFTYRGYQFCIQEAGRILLLRVEDSRCPDIVLHEVQHHFAALLSSHLSD